MDNADDADPSGARCNAPLARHRRRARCHAVSRLREGPGWIAGRHHRAYVHARTEMVRHGDGLPIALLDLRWHEPGRNTRTGGEGLPHVLRCAGDFEFNLNGTATVGFFLHAHDGSLGCATITRRCGRPPGADASWYFATSLVMAAASSAVNAARSAGDRKRTSVSTARVARRLPAFFARRTRSPTSRTIRAPSAMR